MAWIELFFPCLCLSFVAGIFFSVCLLLPPVKKWHCDLQPRKTIIFNEQKQEWFAGEIRGNVAKWFCKKNVDLTFNWIAITDELPEFTTHEFQICQNSHSISLCLQIDLLTSHIPLKHVQIEWFTRSTAILRTITNH